MANQAFAEIMGYDSPDQFYQGFKTTEHYVDPNRRRELLRLLYENGRVDGFEIMSIRPDGTHTEIAVSAIIYPEQGYIEGCIIDMTEKKRAAKEKEQLQAKLQPDRTGPAEYICQCMAGDARRRNAAH